VLHLQGECISSAPWFNLSRQALQPLFQRCARVQVQLQPGAAAGGGTAVSLSTLEACTDQQAAFEGGSCLRLHGAPPCLTLHSLLFITCQNALALVFTP
jgi:hypothetical protein